MSDSDEDRERFADMDIEVVLNFLRDRQEGENRTILKLQNMGITGNIPEHIDALYEFALVELKLGEN